MYTPLGAVRSLEYRRIIGQVPVIDYELVYREIVPLDLRVGELVAVNYQPALRGLHCHANIGNSFVVRNGDGGQAEAVNALEEVFVCVEIANHVGRGAVSRELLPRQAGYPVAHEAPVLGGHDAAIIVVEKILAECGIKQVLLLLVKVYAIHVSES